MVKLKKTDIGGEILSILTRGIYSDPRDALREYIQNGVDAKAKSIAVRIRHKMIVVEDDGYGMNYETMRKSIRLGVSEKDPKRNVGFMGIGIYSSFHLCDELMIYSKVKGDSPNVLSFSFKKMRNILEYQKEARLDGKLDENELLALQSLMENHISLKRLGDDEFPDVGTRVEIIGITSDFFKTLSRFTEVSKYLEEVIPLPYDPRFRWHERITKRINQECKKYKHKFNTINLTLQINDESATLFRPYGDHLFEPHPLPPKFYVLKEKNTKEFFGIAWGCLNASRNSVKNKGLRGFITKKRGFSVGGRDKLLSFFKRQIFYNRYVGEVIVIHPKLLTNASRTDFEFSPLRIAFYDCLTDMASYFNDEANSYQEFSKSDEQINDVIDYLMQTKGQLNYYMDNGEKLLQYYADLSNFLSSLDRREQRGYIRSSKQDKYAAIVKELKALIKEIRSLIELNKTKKEKRPKPDEKIAKEVARIPTKAKTIQETDFNNLIEILESVGVDVTNEMKVIFELLDEKFIQTEAKNKEDYIRRLRELKADIEELLEE